MKKNLAFLLFGILAMPASAEIGKLNKGPDGGPINPTQASVDGQLTWGTPPTKSTGATDGSLTLDTNASLQVGTTFYVNDARVGVGTASPGSLLDVAGQAIIGAAATKSTFTSAGALSVFAGLTVNDEGADVDTRIEASGQANALFVQGSDGAVGFGTASPEGAVSISSDTAPAAGTYNSALGALFIKGKTDTNETVNMGYHSIDNMGFVQSGRQGVAFDPYLINPGGGNVGINLKTTPGAPLEVAGANPVKLTTMTATYASGSAFLCINNSGIIFASEAACP